MSNVLACYQLLELNVISAQDLAPVGRSMRTYAIAWIDPDRKLSTRVDSHGGINPAWNDKFVFRVDEDFLYDDESAITIDIYALHWFRDIHVGTAHVLSSDLFPPSSQPQRNSYKSTGMRFMGLQVQRPSGRPKGILNVGATIIDSSMRSMPLYTHNSSAVGYSHDDHNQPSHQAKPELRRTKSDSSSMLGSEAIAPEHQAKAKKGKANSQVTPSEVSTKSRKKGSSILSGSDVKATPKRGKFGKKKTKITSHDSQNNFNAMVSADYQVKSTLKQEFQNSPAIARTYNNNNNNNNNTYKGSVRATPLHAFAVTNAAMEYGTPYRSNLGRRPLMTDSELGPSASEVAAVIARQPVEEGENSTVGGWSLDDGMEGLKPKVERWQTELAPVYDGSERSNLTESSKKGKHSRRQTEGGNGLFSCFSVICGVECSIVCGGGSGKKNRRRRVQSVDNESFL
ncbi:cyclin D1/2/4 [Spatholobus suberectus]|nr:cyclin D1/2/4 [Spatholobus suberectus]